MANETDNGSEPQYSGVCVAMETTAMETTIYITTNHLFEATKHQVHRHLYKCSQFI